MEEEIHIEVLKELSATNRKISCQLDKTMNILQKKQEELNQFRKACQLILNDLDNNNSRNLLEKNWHELLCYLLQNSELPQRLMVR